MWATLNATAMYMMLSIVAGYSIINPEERKASILSV